MQNKSRKITILGSTGSIGVQTLNVLDSLNGNFELEYLTINTRIDLLEQQLQRYTPKGVVIVDEKAYKQFKNSTNFKGEILCGESGVEEAAASPDNDILLSALVGFSGVIPTLAAIKQGTTVALANKETLVSAGEVITSSAKENNVQILAVDSEHSAVLQSLAGESHESIEKIILTASGGPFRNTPQCEFSKLTVKQALDHPNWSMGNKITIDSATMMNKGFEVIEAFWLFGTPIEKIEVLIHPQSIVHSLVQFVDGSVKAQLGLPDMRIPISYALTYPNRMAYDFPRMDLSQIGCLHFIKPDFDKFPCLGLAYQAVELGGTAPAAVNAANEIAVSAFLNEKIKFTDIAESISYTLKNISIKQKPNIDDIIDCDKESRKITENFIQKLY